MNFFALFGLEASYDIDTTKLAATYKSLAQVTHPDKFSQSGGAEKLMAVQKNAQVNDGYQVLKNPLSRAEHLLSLRGIDMQHETKTLQDPSFLMQQMEWRESLEETSNAADPEAALAALDAELAIQTKLQYSQLADILKADTEQANLDAANRIRKLKFMEKLHREIELKEDALLDD
ncbi:co-chaperone HscB [Aliiglaciecola litoralis]|uniref:Co-chaperone protein HscB homolog n=1 Tax=Aliiglaciecola litoralis TaxID=582857 RepID=A0ABP3WVS1_9ALTE